MSLRPSTLGLLAAASLLVAFVTGARAADLDDNYGYAEASQDVPVPEIPQAKVEFGTGWYVRGDLGATRLPGISNSTPYLPTAENLVAPDAPGIVIGGTSGVGYVASLGAGYKFTNLFRVDGIFDFHQPVKNSTRSPAGAVFCPTGVSYPDEVVNPTTGTVTSYGKQQFATGSCTGTYTSNLQSFDVLINAYIDIGTWYHVTPYVGAGVGLSFGHYQTAGSYVMGNGLPYQITYNDPQYGASYENYDRHGSGTYYNFAYALMAGFAVDVFDHTKLDIGYRYLNLGKLPNAQGELYEHEVRLGVRYMIDN